MKTVQYVTFSNKPETASGIDQLAALLAERPISPSTGLDSQLTYLCIETGTSPEQAVAALPEGTGYALLKGKVISKLVVLVNCVSSANEYAKIVRRVKKQLGQKAAGRAPGEMPVSFPDCSEIVRVVDGDVLAIDTEPADGSRSAVSSEKVKFPVWTPGGQLVTTASKNIEAGLKHLGYSIRFNMLKESIVLDGEPLTDMKAEQLVSELQQLGLTNVSARHVWSAVNAIISADDSLRFHPMRDFCLLRPHDGQDRFQELADTLTLDDRIGLNKKQFAYYCTKWLVTTVRRALMPHMNQQAFCLTLTGAQGKRKSLWYKTMFDYGSSSFYEVIDGDIKSKDFQIGAATNSIIVLEELDNHATKRNSTLLKATITCHSYTVRAPFDRVSRTRRATANYLGSSNDSQFLVDDSGSRRFPSVAVIDITIPAAFDKQQLYAQAYALAQDANYDAFISPEDIIEIEQANGGFKDSDILTDRLATRWAEGEDWLSVPEILLCIEPDSDSSRAETTKIGMWLNRNNIEFQIERVGPQKSQRKIYKCNKSALEGTLTKEQKEAKAEKEKKKAEKKASAVATRAAELALTVKEGGKNAQN